MTEHWMDRHSGARVLFVMAMAVVVVYGLKLAAPMLLPFALALFVAVLNHPIAAWLQRRGLPALLAIALTVLATMALFGVLILLALQSFSELQTRLPQYVTTFKGLVDSALEWGSEQGLPIAGESVTELIDPGRIMNLAGDVLEQAVGFLTNAFLVFLIMVFILNEATIFPAKFRAILGSEEGKTPRIAKIIGEVQQYLGIKTIISLITGILLGLWTWTMGLDFPLLLGLIAFVLNYVPTIGSVLASLPAILLGLVLVGPGHAFVVMLGYLAVNVGLGNFVEPTLMGRRLGLSTLVVVLSLVFWAWLWGPAGALLAVPLTVVVRIFLENLPDLRWIAVLLAKSPPPAPAHEATEA